MLHFALSGAELGVFGRHLQPGTAVADRIGADLDTASGAFRQRLLQHRDRNRLPDDQLRRHLMCQVMLGNEGFNDLRRLHFIGILRKKILVAEVAAAADHHQIDATDAGRDSAGDNVGIAAGFIADILSLAHLAQRADLVSIHRCLFVAQPLRRGSHARIQSFGHRILLAVEKQFGAACVFRIISVADQSHTRRRAAVDLVQQAGPRTMREYAVLAGTQAEHLLQQLYAFAHRARIGKRSEIAMALVGVAAKKTEARIAVSGQHQVRVGLVVAEQDVVARRQRLDQVVFEQQCFRFRAGDSGFDVHDLRHHQADARRQCLGALEIGTDPFP